MAERALSVQDFCTSYGIGKSLYYEQRKLNRMPRTIKVGRRVLMTMPAIEEWRVAMESADTSGTGAAS